MENKGIKEEAIEAMIARMELLSQKREYQVYLFWLTSLTIIFFFWGLIMSERLSGIIMVVLGVSLLFVGEVAWRISEVNKKLK